MAKFEAFRRVISSSINLSFLKSEIATLFSDFCLLCAANRNETSTLISLAFKISIGLFLDKKSWTSSIDPLLMASPNATRSLFFWFSDEEILPRLRQFFKVLAFKLLLSFIVVEIEAKDPYKYSPLSSNKDEDKFVESIFGEVLFGFKMGEAHDTDLQVL